MGITAMFMGYILAAGKIPGVDFLLGAVCFSFIIFGYNSYNAIIDKEIDRINKPYRPLAKGTLSDKDAFYIAVIFFVMALAIAVFLDSYFFWIAVTAILLSIAYSNPLLHFKRRLLLGTLSATILYTILAPLLGWAIYHNDISKVVPFLIFLFFLGVPKAILKDYIDIPGDAYHGVHSIPIKLGYWNSIITVGLLYLFSLVFLFFLIYQRIIDQFYLFILVYYPFMLWNLTKLPKNFNIIDQKDKVFTNAITILMAVEVTIAGIALILS
jgi:geranylgeranylglycerol-phosphate geranylgeranyltransferase